jgi:D-alanyl-D-alanine carboxypeptidase
MAENAWKYGWLMSYPLGDNGELFNPRTCFHYEPWHYRYLGRAMARKVHNSGLTIREYLWEQHTLVDPQTGESLATPTPTPTPSPTPVPMPTATVAPPSASPPASAALTPTPEPATPPASSGGGPLGIDPLVLAALGVAVVVLGSVVLAARRGASTH